MEEDRLTEKENQEIKGLVERTNKDKPKPEDVKALQTMLAKHPQLWRRGGDLAVQNQRKLLSSSGMTTAAREMTEAALDAMRRELDYNGAPMLEQMLIEQVLLSWLRLNIWEYQVSDMGTVSLVVADFWERRLSAAQRRFLRASETLARVRRLARNIPGLQVNIATQDGQQVNIAGNYVKSSRTE